MPGPIFSIRFFVRGRGLFSPEVFAPGLFHALCVSAHGLLFIGVSAHVFLLIHGLVRSCFFRSGLCSFIVYCCNLSDV